MVEYARYTELKMPEDTKTRRGAVTPLINGRYELVRFIADGGVGKVYCVRDTVVEGRHLALKMLWRTQDSPEAQSLFENEFRILAGMRHPNVEAVYEYGVIAVSPVAEMLGHLFFTAELIDGVSITAAVENLTHKEIFGLVVQVCRGLQFLHSHGLVHQDIKPSNILVNHTGDQGGGKGMLHAVRIIDFGLATSVAHDSAVIRGTPHYMAPEVIRREPSDHRSDLYGLGVTMFQLFSRKLPFEANSVSSLLHEHMHQPPPRLSSVAPHIPHELDALIERLLAKEPSERPANANDVIKSLGGMSGQAYELETSDTIKGYLGSTALVGRQSEIEWVQAMWESAAQNRGGPRVAVISAETGMGKSRVLRELSIWAQTRNIPLIAANMTQAAQEPLTLAKTVIAQTVTQSSIRERQPAKREDLVGEYAPFLHEILNHPRLKVSGAKPAAIGPEGDLQRFLARVSDFVLAATLEPGTLVLVDDVQWADETSVNFLAQLARKSTRRANRRLVMVVTRNIDEARHERGPDAIDELIAGGYAEERVLQPLSREQQEDLVRSMFGSGAERVLDKTLGAKDGGNPGFLEETLHCWVDDGLLRFRDWGWELDHEMLKHVTPPRKMEEVAAKRLGRLSQAEMGWLERLALCGGVASHRDLSAWIAMHQDRAYLIDASLLSLMRRGLLRRTDEPAGPAYRFAQESIAAGVLVGMGPRRRSELSEELLRWMEGEVASGQKNVGDEVECLARLARDSGNREAWLKYAEAAVENAERRYVVSDAIKHCEELLDTTTNHARRMDLFVRIARLAQAGGQFKHAADTYSKALAEPSDGDDGQYFMRRAKIQHEMGCLLYGMGHAEARGLFESAANDLSRVERGRDRDILEANILIDHGAAMKDFGDSIQEGEEFIRRGIDIAMRHEDAGVEAMARGEFALGTLKFRLCKLTEAQEHFGAVIFHSMAMKDDVTVARALNAIANVHLARGELERAGETRLEAIAIAERIGHIPILAHLYLNLGDDFLQKWETERAADALAKCAVFAEEGDMRSLKAALLLNEGVLAQMRDDYGAARDSFTSSLQISSRAGAKSRIGMALTSMAYLQLSLHEFDEALDSAARGAEIQRLLGYSLGRAYALNILAMCLHRRGELSMAVHALDECDRLGDETGTTPDRAMAAVTRAAVCCDRGNMDLAFALCKRGVGLAERTDISDIRTEARLTMAYGARTLALARAAQGASSEAEKALGIAERTVESALARCREKRIMARVAACCVSIAETNLCQGRLDRARIAVDEAEKAAVATGRPHALQVVAVLRLRLSLAGPLSSSTAGRRAEIERRLAALKPALGAASVVIRIEALQTAADAAVALCDVAGAQELRAEAMEIIVSRGYRTEPPGLELAFCV
jgi:tetratricopeptide (TPR) repeat protein